MKILLAEDHEPTLSMLTLALETMDHEVVGAANGLQAWAAYQAGGLRVLITDWLMPEMDGLELVKRIRGAERSHYTYIIMLTSLEGRERYFEGIDAGADDFLNKPCDINELTARLRVAERIVNLQAELRQLEGLLPICSYCKKIADERREWIPLEKYISERSDADFSHGICPQCAETALETEMARWRASQAAE
jgi:phosphoserine phosphatase RsbU/P